jgi:hypothetical protein
MADEYSNNPRGDSKEIFSKQEAQVSNISHNTTILVVALESEFGPFRGVW